MWRQRLQPLTLLSHVSAVAMCHLLHRPGLVQAVPADNCAYSWQVPKEVCFVLCLVPPPAFSYCRAVSSSARTSIKAALRQTDFRNPDSSAPFCTAVSLPPLQLSHSLSKLLNQCATPQHHHLTTTHAPYTLIHPPTHTHTLIHPPHTHISFPTRQGGIWMV